MIKDQVKEQPIIFNTEMIRAILDGRKTQTRQVLQPQPELEEYVYYWKGMFFNPLSAKDLVRKECPYGNIGNRLWVKKTWGYKRVSSLFRPRQTSRMTLEIIDIRVERLQEITEEDAIAEGIWGKGEPYQGIGDLPSDRFRDLWDSLNAKRGYSWDINPWVWVIEFKRIEKT